MDSVHVFFFRGLSTYGHDHAKWSLLNFGPVYRHLQRELELRGALFHPVLGMGAGSLDIVADRAYQSLVGDPVWQDPHASVFFLGHSAGGIIARLVAHRLQRSQLRGVLTVATPHLGSGMAQHCLDLPERFRGSYRTMRLLGYDVARKTKFFGELTPARVESALAETMRPSATVDEASIVCWAPRREWCAPLRAFYKLKAFKTLDVVSDGVVERDSQPWGKVIAELHIDHFRQVGLFGEGHRFMQLCDEIMRHFRSV